MGKGRNAGNQHFLFFPQCFLAKRKIVSLAMFYLSSAKTFNLVTSKNFVVWYRVRYSSPNDKTSDRSKLKAFSDDKISVNEKLKFGLGRVENMVGKGENAGNQHFFSPFSHNVFNVFKRPPSQVR